MAEQGERVDWDGKNRRSETLVDGFVNGAEARMRRIERRNLFTFIGQVLTLLALITAVFRAGEMYGRIASDVAENGRTIEKLVDSVDALNDRVISHQAVPHGGQMNQ